MTSETSFTPSSLENTSENASLNHSLRKNRSNIHNYCRPVPKEQQHDENGRRLYHCNLCPGIFKSTTNFRSHYRNVHGIDIELNSKESRSAGASEAYRSLYSKVRGQYPELDDEILKGAVDAEVIKKALIELILVRNLSFRLVETEEFRAFCYALNPQVIPMLPSCHQTIANQVREAFPLEKDIVRKALQSAITQIHLSVDIWTSPSNCLVLGICAHFVDVQERRFNILLALPTVAGHSGSHQWAVLLPVLRNYDIVRKVGAIIGDNSTTNDVLCRTISQYLAEEERISWNATQQRIRCQGHVINLVVEAFLFEKKSQLDLLASYEEEERLEFEGDDEDTGAQELPEKNRKEKDTNIRVIAGVLGKLHNVVVHIRASPGRTKQFEERAGRRIPLDNRTRWNSWWSMLDVAIQLQETMSWYITEHLDSIDKSDVLSPQDWSQLRTIHKFLGAFKSATLKLQGGNATLDKVLNILDILNLHVKKTLDTIQGSRSIASKSFNTRVLRCKAKLDSYYQKLLATPLYATALILNPNRRATYINSTWPEDTATQAIWQTKQLWERYRREQPLASASYETFQSGPLKEPLDEFDRLAFELEGEYTRPKSQDEFESYNSEVSYEYIEDSIKWWLSQTRYPQLAGFAVNILSIPAMSDKVETTFSGGRRTIGWERVLLGADILEITECTKDWRRSRITVDIL